MARRKPKYPDRPHLMREEIRKKFQAFIDQGQKQPKGKAPIQPKGGWDLFRWDTLEDVKQE